MEYSSKSEIVVPRQLLSDSFKCDSTKLEAEVKSLISSRLEYLFKRAFIEV